MKVNLVYCTLTFYKYFWTPRCSRVKNKVILYKKRERERRSHVTQFVPGGCGGPNMVFSDVWLLSMTDPVWTWREVAVRNPQWGATHMWCHPACKVFHFTMLL